VRDVGGAQSVSELEKRVAWFEPVCDAPDLIEARELLDRLG